MKHLALAGRILFGVVFIVFGVNHVLNASAVAAGVPGYFPGPGTFWVYVTGVVFVLAGLAVSVGKYAGWGGLAVSVVLLVFIAVIHIPGLRGEETRTLSMVMLLKDAGLLAAGLMVAGRYGLGMRKKMHSAPPESPTM